MVRQLLTLERLLAATILELSRHAGRSLDWRRLDGGGGKTLLGEVLLGAHGPQEGLELQLLGGGL